MITEQKPAIGCGVSTIMKGSRESVAGRASGLPAPVSVRHGKPKGRRRPRLPADGSGNQCLRRASLAASLSIRSRFAARDPGELPRRVTSASPLHRALWECPARGAIAWRACVFALHVAACIPRGSESARQVPTHPPQYLDQRAGGRALRYAAGSPINLGGCRLI